jgi:ribonuclease HI
MKKITNCLILLSAQERHQKLLEKLSDFDSPAFLKTTVGYLDSLSTLKYFQTHPLFPKLSAVHTQKKHPKNPLYLYCDGGARGNPGLGACAYLVCNSQGQLLTAGGLVWDNVTNNQMEIMGLLWGCLSIDELCQKRQKSLDSVVILAYSDSQYVVKALQSWIEEWRARGWKKKKLSEDIKNLGLWKALDIYRNDFPQLQIAWMKAHSQSLDSVGNILVDSYLNYLMDQWKKSIS